MKHMYTLSSQNILFQNVKGRKNIILELQILIETLQNDCNCIDIIIIIIIILCFNKRFNIFIDNTVTLEEIAYECLPDPWHQYDTCLPLGI